ncbi:uncharacterized protein [Argopecten irradians]|uniref:uncharacterized protein n=1 Tax=Argopecten irradians TaxID=31199 RepID=UPI003715E650
MVTTDLHGFTFNHFLVTIITLACIVPMVTNAAPLPGYQEKWRNPCEIPSPTFEPYETTNAQKSSVLQDLLLNLQVAENVISDLKMEYRTHRVAGRVSNGSCVSSLENNLDNVYRHVDGFPDLAPYFLSRNFLAICENISTTFLHDYKILVPVMIFLEETIEEDYQNNNATYFYQLTELHNALKGVMCKFHQIEQRCGAEEQTLDATELIHNYKVSPNYDPRERDYLLIRDTGVLVRALHGRYDNCLTLFRKISS